MKFEPLPVDGSFLVHPRRIEDERGAFSRIWCADEMAQHGLDTAIAQCSTSYNVNRGTLRGMHWQEPPHAETKTVRVTRGRIFDVIVDLRKAGSTYLKWYGIELDANEGKVLYVPKGCAHGFLTLEDQTEVAYQISTPYEPAASRVARYDDPAFGIEWPEAPRIISTRDMNAPPFRP